VRTAHVGFEFGMLMLKISYCAVVTRDRVAKSSLDLGSHTAALSGEDESLECPRSNR